MTLPTNFDAENSDREKTRVFVASIMQLYHLDLDVRRVDGFHSLCHAHHAGISKMTMAEYNDRLFKIKKLTAVPNFKGFLAKYFTAQDALRIACGELHLLNHDYHLVYPIIIETGAIEAIRESLEIPRDEELAKQQLKDLHDFMNSKIGKN